MPLSLSKILFKALYTLILREIKFQILFDFAMMNFLLIIRELT